jgi:regulator of protease activity HflC (stomatin/prohibitin superfamily)
VASAEPAELGLETLVFVLLLIAWTVWRKRAHNTMKDDEKMDRNPDSDNCVNELSDEHASPPSASDSYAVIEDSLKSTFRILKYVMILLLFAFAVSGLFFGEEGEVAVHTRLGRIVGEPGREVVEPGGPYFALPSPLDEIRRAPTSVQEVVLDNSFWFRETEADAQLPLERRMAIESLAPEVHGSLLTGDKNIVHARWSASFRIARRNGDLKANALLFFRNVGSMERAKVLLAESLERAIIRVVGRTSVNAFYKGDIDTEAIQQLVQGEMDGLQSGLAVTAVSLKDRTVPLATLRDFQAAGQAESEKARLIEEAGQERAHILNRAAGAGHERLLAALDAYEKARAGGEADAIQVAEAAVGGLLLGYDVGGAVSSLIRSAMTSRTQTVQFVRGASQRFEAMLDLYNENPSLYRSRQIQDAIQRIFQDDVETFYLPEGSGKTLYLEVGSQSR